MSETAQCPLCELRFQARWELKLHLESDHPGAIRDKDTGDVIVEDNDPNAPKPL